MKSFALVILAAAIASLAPISRADSPAAPSTSPVSEKMKIVVSEVHGLVQVRLDPAQAWQPAKAGMEVGQGAEFRTGPRSSVTCTIPPDQVLVLDRLGTVRIDEAIRSGNKLKTDVEMKYGRTHYEIEAAGIEHDSTIRSPGSTLAVRGTSVTLYDQPPFVPEALSFHGNAFFRNAQREMRFGGRTLVAVANDKPSAPDTALAKQSVDPRSAHSRSSADSRYIADQSSSSELLNFDRLSLIPVIQNGPPPPTDAQLTNEAATGQLPGKLDVVIRWSGNANINLNVGELNGTNGIALLNGVQTHLSEFLYPLGGLNRSASGGTIPYDNRGGSSGGMEIAYWNTPPAGLYNVSAIHISGAPALVKFNIFLDGKPLDNLTTFQVDSTGNLVTDSNGFPILVKNTQITRPIDQASKPASAFGPQSGVASVQSFIPSIPALDDPTPVEPPVAFGASAKHKSAGPSVARSTPAQGETTHGVSVTQFRASSVGSSAASGRH